MNRRYAAGTSVSKGRTLDEIERTVSRFGAAEFGQAVLTEPVAKAGIYFRKAGITYRVTMPLPSPDDAEFTRTPVTRDRRTPEKARALWEQRTLEKWRALAAYVKALLVAVEEGVVSFEECLLPHMIGPGGQTVAEVYVPQALAAANDGRLPTLTMFGEQPKGLTEGSDATERREEGPDGE